MPTKAEAPADLIVVHNRVRGKPRLGSNGFRAWLARPAAVTFGAIANGRRTSPFTTAWNRMGQRVKAGRSSAPQVVCCFRRHLALAARLKCVLHGGREFLVHPLELLGRIGADIVAGSRGLDPK